MPITLTSSSTKRQVPLASSWTSRRLFEQEEWARMLSAQMTKVETLKQTTSFLFPKLSKSWKLSRIVIKNFRKKVQLRLHLSLHKTFMTSSRCMSSLSFEELFPPLDQLLSEEEQALWIINFNAYDLHEYRRHDFYGPSYFQRNAFRLLRLWNSLDWNLFHPIMQTFSACFTRHFFQCFERLAEQKALSRQQHHEETEKRSTKIKSYQINISS